MLIRSSKNGSAKAERKHSGLDFEKFAPGASLLRKDFFRRNSLDVSRDLLGKILVVRTGRALTAARIVETEAYRRNDPACHAHAGETSRSAIMFGEPGRVYVYFIYGMYEMLNFVTEPKGEPGAVLIRAVEPLHGLKTMQARRPNSRNVRDLTNGPGRLCLAMGVELDHKGDSLFGPRYFVLDDGYEVESVSVSPRVGITKATDYYWRYFITGHPFVSKAPQNKLSRELK